MRTEVILGTLRISSSSSSSSSSSAASLRPDTTTGPHSVEPTRRAGRATIPRLEETLRLRRLRAAAVRLGSTRRLASTPGEPRWTPPSLRALPGQSSFLSEWSWMGELDRFELVKSLRRSSRGGANGSSGEDEDEELEDDELELATLCLEAAESHMLHECFGEALPLLERVLDLAPSCTLAWYKLALCTLAMDGPSALEGGDAAELFRCAASLEPGNEPLRANIDLALRVHARVKVPEDYWKRERCPRSGGDVIALVAMVRRSEWYAERLRAERIEEARAARLERFDVDASASVS